MVKQSFKLFHPSASYEAWNTEINDHAAARYITSRALMIDKQVPELIEELWNGVPAL